MKPKEELTIRGELYQVLGLLGKGKSGYSYLVARGFQRYVYKQIHHEPCNYYQFGDKLGAELEAYEVLSNLGFPVSHLVDYNQEEDYLVKEFIDGPTAAELTALGRMDEVILAEIFTLANRLYQADIHIDFFPTNFVLTRQGLFLVDYEYHTPYEHQWDFETWGLYFWLNQQGMKDYLASGDLSNLCVPGTGKPITGPFTDRAADLIRRYSKTYNPIS